MDHYIYIFLKIGLELKIADIVALFSLKDALVVVILYILLTYTELTRCQEKETYTQLTALLQQLTTTSLASVSIYCLGVRLSIFQLHNIPAS